MLLDKLLGLSIKDLKEVGKDSVVASNNVNSTVELKDVTSTFDDGSHHALFFFDLADNNIMTMAVVKFEKLKLLQRWRIGRMRNIQCQGYIGCVTFTGKDEAVITYVRENIIKAL